MRFSLRLNNDLPVKEYALLARHAEALGDFALLRGGNRLSVLPVTAAQYKHILTLE